MKKYLGIILLFLFLTGIAKSQAIFRIDSIPAKGILLDKSWKWHLGDNPDFAKVDFDDSTWENIDPTKDIYDLPQIPKTGDIFWLRLHLVIDSSLNQPFVMMTEQSGASEIYLNGKLIYTFGKLNSNIGKINAYNPKAEINSLPIRKASEQIFSVRYALQPNIYYSNHFGMQNRCLSISINSPDIAIVNREKIKEFGIGDNLLKIGIFLILCILYFVFYFYNPKQKANLYFTIYSFLQILMWANGLFSNSEHQVKAIFWFNNFTIILGVISLLFLMTAIYQLFERKVNLIYLLLCLLGIACIWFGIYVRYWGWLVFSVLFIILISMEIFRVSILSVKKNRKGAWIITVGAICFFIFWLLFNFFAIKQEQLIPGYFFSIAHLSIPLSVAIFLGYDFAQTNISLKQKLKEVETLSEEKQQILAIQNETLERQVETRTIELSKSLTDLKATQAQLIQSEKMASLGELTAGIAHEIQNPLNFVNNFSEVSSELVDEAAVELNKGDLVETKAILGDLKGNLDKINHHGKRASSIVKGMLEHSRTSSGQKELTDINALADEYLRLAYHGLRARDRSFNADFKTDLDPNLPKIEIIPQDIGRVLLNLINNAFQAVGSEGIKNPTVTVRTERVASHLGVGDSAEFIQITVTDNGPGIPNEIKDKIFQPFFTTKPTGQGTGLGLSLAYDIVKAHGGELRVESEVNVGSSFIIQIPLK